MNMPQLQRSQKEKVEVKKEKELLGTLLSVISVGLFIVLSWAAVYLLYLSR
jgi:nitrate reductase NapE component